MTDWNNIKIWQPKEEIFLLFWTNFAHPTLGGRIWWFYIESSFRFFCAQCSLPRLIKKMFYVFYLFNVSRDLLVLACVYVGFLYVSSSSLSYNSMCLMRYLSLYLSSPARERELELELMLELELEVLGRLPPPDWRQQTISSPSHRITYLEDESVLSSNSDKNNILFH